MADLPSIKIELLIANFMESMKQVEASLKGLETFAAKINSGISGMGEAIASAMIKAKKATDDETDALKKLQEAANNIPKLNRSMLDNARAQSKTMFSNINIPTASMNQTSDRFLRLQPELLAKLPKDFGKQLDANKTALNELYVRLQRNKTAFEATYDKSPTALPRLLANLKDIGMQLEKNRADALALARTLDSIKPISKAANAKQTDWYQKGPELKQAAKSLLADSNRINKDLVKFGASDTIIQQSKDVTTALENIIKKHQQLKNDLAQTGPSGFSSFRLGLTDLQKQLETNIAKYKQFVSTLDSLKPKPPPPLTMKMQLDTTAFKDALSKAISDAKAAMTRATTEGQKAQASANLRNARSIGIAQSSVPGMGFSAGMQEALQRQATSQLRNLSNQSGKIAPIEVKLNVRGGESITEALQGVRSLSSAVGALGRMFPPLAASALIFDMISAAVSALIDTMKQLFKQYDAWVSLVGRLRIVTDSQAQLNFALSSTLDIANEVGVSVAATADIYYQFGKVAQQTGADLNQVNTVVETIQKSFIIGGTGPQAMQGALIQLGQGMTEGILRGQEFRSVMQQMGPLGLEIAKAFGTTTGGLRKMAMEGKLTSKAFMDAVILASESIDEQFSKMPVTFSRATATLDNAWTQFIGVIAEQGDIFQPILRSVVTFAKQANKALKSVLFDGKSMREAFNEAFGSTPIPSLLDAIGEVVVSLKLVWDVLANIGEQAGPGLSVLLVVFEKLLSIINRAISALVLLGDLVLALPEVFGGEDQAPAEGKVFKAFEDFDNRMKESSTSLSDRMLAKKDTKIKTEEEIEQARTIKVDKVKASLKLSEDLATARGEDSYAVLADNIRLAREELEYLDIAQSKKIKELEKNKQEKTDPDNKKRAQEKIDDAILEGIENRKKAELLLAQELKKLDEARLARQQRYIAAVESEKKLATVTSINGVDAKSGKDIAANIANITTSMETLSIKAKAMNAEVLADNLKTIQQQMADQAKYGDATQTMLAKNAEAYSKYKEAVISSITEIATAMNTAQNNMMSIANKGLSTLEALAKSQNKIAGGSAYVSIAKKFTEAWGLTTEHTVDQMQQAIDLQEKLKSVGMGASGLVPTVTESDIVAATLKEYDSAKQQYDDLSQTLDNLIVTAASVGPEVAKAFFSDWFTYLEEIGASITNLKTLTPDSTTNTSTDTKGGSGNDSSYPTTSGATTDKNFGTVSGPRTKKENRTDIQQAGIDSVNKLRTKLMQQEFETLAEMVRKRANKALIDKNNDILDSQNHKQSDTVFNYDTQDLQLPDSRIYNKGYYEGGQPDIPARRPTSTVSKAVEEFEAALIKAMDAGSAEAIKMMAIYQENKQKIADQYNPQGYDPQETEDYPNRKEADNQAKQDLARARIARLTGDYVEPLPAEPTQHIPDKIKLQDPKPAPPQRDFSLQPLLDALGNFFSSKAEASTPASSDETQPTAKDSGLVSELLSQINAGVALCASQLSIIAAQPQSAGSTGNDIIIGALDALSTNIQSIIKSIAEVYTAVTSGSSTELASALTSIAEQLTAINSRLDTAINLLTIISQSSGAGGADKFSEIMSSVATSIQKLADKEMNFNQNNTMSITMNNNITEKVDVNDVAEKVSSIIMRNIRSAGGGGGPFA